MHTISPNPFVIPGIRRPGPCASKTSSAQPGSSGCEIPGSSFCLWACSLYMATWMLFQNSLPLGGHTGTLCGHTCHGMDGEPGLTWPLWGSEGEEPPSGATDMFGFSHNRTTELSSCRVHVCLYVVAHVCVFFCAGEYLSLSFSLYFCCS